MFIRAFSGLPHPSERIAEANGLISHVWYDKLGQAFAAIKSFGEGYPITGSYTVEANKAGQTIYTTSGTGTITYGAATGYGATHSNTITNTSTRRWSVDLAGTVYFLWPGQSGAVFRVGNQWVAWIEGRWYTRATTTFHVNHSTGNDANDGLADVSGGNLATIQKAIDLIERYVDNGVNGIAIQVHSTSFTENNVVHTKRLQGNHVIFLNGDHATPANCVWNIAAGNVGLIARDWSGVIVDGFKMVSAGAGSIGLTCSQHGIIDVWNIEFGVFAGGIHVQSTNGGSVGYVVGGACSITGNFAIHHNVSANSQLICTGMTYSVPNARTFTQFLTCTINATALYAGVTFSGAGSAGGSVGQKYYVDQGARLFLNGVVLPGATAGAADAATFATAV